jgi:hypothetical protein
MLPNGLKDFKGLHQDRENAKIEPALDKLIETCEERNETAVVAGHHIFWHTNQTPKTVTAGIDKDRETYNQIIHYNVDPNVVAVRRLGADRLRYKAEISVEELREWQDLENTQVREICRKRKVCFTTVTETASTVGSVTLARIKGMLMDSQQHTEASNLTAVESALDTALAG